jgi:hypothetical protein
MAERRKLIRRCTSAVSKVAIDRIITNLELLFLGVKPCYLVDATRVTVEQMDMLLKQWPLLPNHACQRSNFLIALLQVDYTEAGPLCSARPFQDGSDSGSDGDVFILNRSQLSRLSIDPVLVDARAQTMHPAVATNSILAGATDLMCWYAVELQKLAEQASTHYVILAAPPSSCLVALTGWLLVYPVLYWVHDAERHSTSNCLRDMQLTVYSADLKLEGYVATRCTCCLLISELYAGRTLVRVQGFSVPAALEETPTITMAVESWRRLFEDQGCHVTVTTASLSQVAL